MVNGNLLKFNSEPFKEEFYEAVAKQRMKFIRDAVKVPYTLREMIMTPIDQEQLIIYNYLLRIIV